MVDIIEWGEGEGKKPHIEFHIHSKNNKIDLAVEPGDKNGKPVLWIMYDLAFRGERICRHVLAPAHFKEGMQLYTYRDDSDKDYDNIFISGEEMKGKKLVSYAMPKYQPCLDENASNKPGSTPAALKLDSIKIQVQPAPTPTPSDSKTNSNPASFATPSDGKKDGKNIGVDYENHSVPFSF